MQHVGSSTRAPAHWPARFAVSACCFRCTLASAVVRATVGCGTALRCVSSPRPPARATFGLSAPPAVPTAASVAVSSHLRFVCAIGLQAHPDRVGASGAPDLRASRSSRSCRPSGVCRCAHGQQLLRSSLTSSDPALGWAPIGAKAHHAFPREGTTERKVLSDFYNATCQVL